MRTENILCMKAHLQSGKDEDALLCFFFLTTSVKITENMFKHNTWGFILQEH